MALGASPSGIFSFSDFTAHVFLFSGAVLNCVNQEEE